MTHDMLKGAVVPELAEISSESYDQAFGSTANDLMGDMSQQAYGADYPAEVEPWGTTTWWTLGRFVSGLRCGPGDVLLDVACGRGGVGLWLARATGSTLVGVDFSPVAVHAATTRSSQFLPKGRARFVVGDLAATGLDDNSVDAAIGADSVFFAIDRVAVFAEMRRILRPGGTFMFNADDSDDERPSAVPDWSPLIEAGGLLVENREEIPRLRERTQALYDTWMSRIDEVRGKLGDEFADELIDEVTRVAPTLPGRTGMLCTARRTL